jgi:phosphatidylserine/phosphatidylglycerophosphate/cardiolipin synthase-like enzyme
MAFSFTSRDLATALLERQRAGVRVSGLMEASQVESNIGSQYERFAAAGLDIRLDGNPKDMHHKVLVIDRRLVVMGSYNFTVSAERRNDENTLIVDDPGLPLTSWMN